MRTNIPITIILLILSVTATFPHISFAFERCTGEQIETMIKAGFSKEDIMRLCGATVEQTGEAQWSSFETSHEWVDSKLGNDIEETKPKNTEQAELTLQQVPNIEGEYFVSFQGVRDRENRVIWIIDRKDQQTRIVQYKSKAQVDYENNCQKRMQEYTDKMLGTLNGEMMRDKQFVENLRKALTPKDCDSIPGEAPPSPKKEIAEEFKTLKSIVDKNKVRLHLSHQGQTPDGGIWVETISLDVEPVNLDEGINVLSGSYKKERKWYKGATQSKTEETIGKIELLPIMKGTMIQEQSS